LKERNSGGILGRRHSAPESDKISFKRCPAGGYFARFRLTPLGYYLDCRA
jgi:hypothetical protein